MSTRHPSDWRNGIRTRVLVLGLASCLLGCEGQMANLDEPIAVYRDRMLVENPQEELPAPEESPRVVARPVASQSQLPDRASLLVEPVTSTQPTPEDVLEEIPDPADAPLVFEKRMQQLREEQAGRRDQRMVRNYERTVEKATEYLEFIKRPEELRLGLAECIQRALEHNYSIRIEAYNPAISRAQIVEAEAAFDVEFFLDAAYRALDQATAATFAAGTSDTRSVEGGFRKLLPTGMQAQISSSLSRGSTDLPSEFQTLDPAYNMNLITSLRQPLLRGFGLEVNRAEINIRKAEQRISYERFIQKVRDTLLDVESAYWQLAQARRTASVLAVSTAQNFITYQNMLERLDHDATQVEVANSESRWRQRYVEYLETVKVIRDAEDTLKNLLNDPGLRLSDNVEIIPFDTPFVAPIALDHFAAVRTALDQRSEIREAREQIERTRINTMLAKNEILPQLDVTFQYELQGIGESANSAWQDFRKNRFVSYSVLASFSYDFGERKGRARWHQARMQESQAVIALNQVSDQIVQEVNNIVRTLLVRWEQVPPQLASVQAAARNLRALQARTQRIDPTYLETELAAVEQVANTRRTLLSVIIQYNVGLVELEKAKGTLLDYNNVRVIDDPYGG